MTPIFASALALAVFLFYITYRLALPKPLPGIPYNAHAAKSLFGDIPGLVAEMSHRGDFAAWLTEQNLKSHSAISQIFLRPFGRPFVVLADHREAHDIFVNRGKEFDRTNDTIDIFRPLFKTQQIVLKTGPKWKKHRRLVQDTMTPRFLHEVAAPSIYVSALRFVDLWKSKADLADGRPFAAAQDLMDVTLDAVLAFSFGSNFPHSAVKAQAEGLRMAGSTSGVAVFSRVDLGSELEAMVKLAEEVGNVQSHYWPRMKWLFIKWTGTFRRRHRVKAECIQGEIKKAVRHRATSSGQDKPRNAVELMLGREERLSAQHGRAPDYFGSTVMDELYGFVVAGHEGTGNTLCWAVKLLADHSAVQSRLRDELRIAFSTAMSEDRQPTVNELATTIPYLDAVTEEVLRVGSTLPLNSRQATQDTIILGHAIPKDTIVMFLNQGPSYLLPCYRIDESLRSMPSEDEEKSGRARTWDPETAAQFIPERWLRHDGKFFVFDPQAGPIATFGMGLRACFGRRLAYMELKMILAMLVWNFELLPCPKELSGYEKKLVLTGSPRKCYVHLREIDSEDADVPSSSVPLS